QLALSSSRDPGTDRGAGLASDVRPPVSLARTEHVPRDVDAVGDGSGDPASVLPALHLRAHAVVAPGHGMVVTTRAWVGRQHHHAAGGVDGRLLATGDPDLTTFHGLAQRL